MRKITGSYTWNRISLDMFVVIVYMYGHASMTWLHRYPDLVHVFELMDLVWDTFVIIVYVYEVCSYPSELSPYVFDLSSCTSLLSFVLHLNLNIFLLLFFFFLLLSSSLSEFKFSSSSSSSSFLLALHLDKKKNHICVRN